MNSHFSFSNWLRRCGWVIWLIALVQFILHLWVNSHDTFFRDELYYLTAGQHLSGGYVEFPPFVALAAAFSRTVLGSSVLAIRLLPALAGALIVLLTADMVAVLGGGLLAQSLAAVSIALAPVFIGSSGLLTMDPFDQLWWTLAAWVLVRLIKRRQARLWLAFGLVAGFGLLTKLTITFFILALILGLLLSEQRSLLFNRWLVFAGLIAFIMVSPYLLWQTQHGFPVLEYTRAYASGKTYQATPIEFFVQQATAMNPLALPLWLGGLYFLFFTAAGKPYRAFGWAYLFLYGFFMLQKAKFYWLSPAYPMLFAGGSYAFERLATSTRAAGRLTWLSPAYLLIIVLSGGLLAPFAIPILPPEAFLKLSGGSGGIKSENLQSSALPQNFADRYGWREMATAVKAAYATLTPQEQSEACILASNYGEAGAIDFYGPALGLPKAISGHNSYFIWGPQGCTGKVIISINTRPQDITSSFESVELVGQTVCTYCMPFENNAPIAIARGLKLPIDAAWAGAKSYN
ncbi:MAG: glycosyltransferase family 39 protein [Anaerolineaceae bacterium]|nr:glycosyltransferase family 39 protein [Anaerolineaceae bacterium]